MDWIDKVIEFAKVMTKEEYKEILNVTDLTCEHCGNCCIIPDLQYLKKLPRVRCRYLTKDTLCEIYDRKPQPCVDFPYMNRFDWLVKFKLAPPRKAIEFCHIVKKFWIEAHRYMKLKNVCEACQVCDTCQVEY